MKAVILAGGLGTRLRPLTLEIPKPLIPVQGRTLTEHVMDLLKEAGVTEVYLAIGYLKEQIKDYFGNGKKFGLKIMYIEEDVPLGTAGWMKRIPKIKGDFFVINGDNLFDISLSELMEFHKKNKGLVTIALTEVDDVTHYGIVELKDNKILRFVEKPLPKDAPSNLANSGYYILNEKVFDMLPKIRTKFMFEKDIFPKIAKKRQLFGFPSKASWFDTGTFERWDDVIKHWRK